MGKENITGCVHDSERLCKVICMICSVPHENALFFIWVCNKVESNISISVFLRKQKFALKNFVTYVYIFRHKNLQQVSSRHPLIVLEVNGSTLFSHPHIGWEKMLKREKRNMKPSIERARKESSMKKFYILNARRKQVHVGLLVSYSKCFIMYIFSVVNVQSLA